MGRVNCAFRARAILKMKILLLLFATFAISHGEVNDTEVMALGMESPSDPTPRKYIGKKETTPHPMLRTGTIHLQIQATNAKG